MEPVIVPPTPTVTQGGDVTALVKGLFDKALPEIKGTPKSQTPPPSTQPKTEPQKTPPAPVEPAAEPKKEPPQTEPKPAEKPSKESHEIPSFLEEALKIEPVKRPTTEDPAEFSDELPVEERRTKIKSLRDAYKKLKTEHETLLKRPTGDSEATTARIAQQDETIKQQSALLSRLGVEQHPDFINNVLNPLHASWNQACRIVKESGANPEDLRQAMSKTGKEQFEALDQVLESIPVSARDEVNNALRNYRHLENIRKSALSNAPKTFEALRKKDMADQYKVLETQRKEMQDLFEGAVKKLRDEAHVEVLMTSSDPDAEEWNKSAEKLIQDARSLYLENTDLEKMAMATILAPMADRYRKLWLSERAAHQKTKGLMDGKFNAEPNLSQSGGNHKSMPADKFKESLKRPFKDVFLDKLHEVQAGRRGA